MVQQQSKLSMLGHFLGHAAVVASLLYVGYEIRLNTRVAQAQAHQDLVGLVMSLSDPIISEINGVTELRAMADSGLTAMPARERQQFDSYMNRLMNVYELAFDQYKNDLLDPDVWEGYRAGLQQLFERPGVVEYWSADKTVFGPRFAAYVDSLVTSGPK